MIKMYTPIFREEPNKIPFEFSLDPFYSKENMERLRKSIAQMESSGSYFKDNNS